MRWIGESGGWRRERCTWLKGVAVLKGIGVLYELDMARVVKLVINKVKANEGTLTCRVSEKDTRKGLRF